MKIHPSDEALEDLLLSLSEERQEILFHASTCPWCRSRLYYLPRSPEEPEIVVPPPRTSSWSCWSSRPGSGRPSSEKLPGSAPGEFSSSSMLPVFASGKIDREALAALAFFRQAVDAEQAGLEVVTRVADYLRRARHDPELSFVRD